MFLYPDVGSAGLVNRLAVWACCEVLSAEYRVPIIAPQWVRLKVGPLLRGDRDLRIYNGFFGVPRDYIVGVRRLFFLTMCELFPVSQLQSESPRQSGLLPRIAVVSVGDVNWDKFVCRRELIVSRFNRLVRACHLERAAQLAPTEPTIMVHLRRGDFGVPSPYGTLPMPGNMALSNEWVVACLRDVRTRLPDLPIWLFTDAAEDMLGEILVVPGLTVKRGGNALVELLLLSKASLLIASPWSTYSAWAALCGGMPVVWTPNYFSELFTRFGFIVAHADAYGRLDWSTLSAFATAVHSRPQ